MSDWARRLAASFATVALALAGPARPAGASAPAADSARFSPAPRDTALAFPAAADSALIDSTAADSASARLAGRAIRRITIEPRNVFEPVPPGRLGPFYRLANHLHVRTRPRTIREQLLFAPGDPWNDAVARETVRNLRALDYLVPEEITPQAEGESLNVVVRTRDSWTTAVEFNLESTGGERFGSVAITERNLLGLGKSVSLSRRVEPSGISRTVGLSDPAVLGSRLRFQFDAGTGSGGAYNHLGLGVPFFAEDTPLSYGVNWQRSTSVMRLYTGPAEIVNLDERFEETEVMWGRGRRVDGTITRGVLSFLVRDRRLGPSRFLVDSAAVPVDFVGGEENLHLRRFAAELRLWHPHFIERRDVDRMTGIEDFDVGATSTVKLGLSPRVLGSTANEAYAKLSLNLGTETRHGFGWARGSLESRFRWTPIETLRRLDARWITAPVAEQRLILSVLGLSGERVARDFQVSIGGLNGLRAFPVRELTGTRAWRMVAEDRWVPRHTDTQLVAIGATAFVDAARAWGSGAAGTGWRSDAGVGLRLATPRTAMREVIRLDVAYPLQLAPGAKREPVFSFGSSQAF